MEKYTKNHKIALASVWVVFFIDILTPLEFVDGIFYMFSFVLLRGASKKFIYGILFLTMLCNAIAIFLHFNDAVTTEILVNRGISMLAVIISAFWTLWDKRHIERKQEIKNNLNSEIKEKEEEIKKMNAYFFSLIENMFEGIQLINDKHQFIYVNKTLELQARIKREDLLGYTIEEKFPTLANSQLIQVIDHALVSQEQQKFTLEYSFEPNQTSVFDLFFYPVKEGIFILSVDITEKNKAEKLRKEYTAQLEEMLHITSHKVRQPVSNLIGIMHQLIDTDTPEQDTEQLYAFMKLSCLRLEVFIKELNDFLQRAKIKSEAEQ